MAELSSRLPDSAFACPEKRLYPHHRPDGEIDMAHLRNALSRVGDASNDQCGKAHLMAHRREQGMGEAGSKALMPVHAKAMLSDEIDAFFAGETSWPILAVPFGGPIPRPRAPRGADLDGQWFSERTDLFGGYAALKATMERPVDWHHSYAPLGDHPSSRVMAGVVLGKAVLRDEPDDDGLWADLWARYGEARLAKVKALVQRGVQLFGSAHPTHPLDTAVVPATGEITRYPVTMVTITTSPQNTYAVVRPKAVLDDFDTAQIAVSGELRDLFTELDALGADLPLTSSGRSGDAAAKARGVLSPAGRRALDNALASWESLGDDLRRA